MLMATLSGCFEDPGTEKLLESEFVSLSVTSQQTGESDGSGEILVEISKAQSTDVQVNFSVAALNAVNGVDFILIGTSVTIPAGEFSATIPYTVVDNDAFEPESRSFTVTITDISPAQISVQGNSEIEVALLNDDCPVNTGVWFGAVTIEDVGFAEVTGSAAANAGGDCDILVVTGDYVGAAAAVTWHLTPSVPGATSGTAEAPKQAYACCAPDYEYEAAGTYDEVTGIITADYTFYNEDGSIAFLGTTVITAQ